MPFDVVVVHDVEEAIIHAANLFTGPGNRTVTVSDETSPEKGIPILQRSALFQIVHPRNRLTMARDVDIFNMVGQFFGLVFGWEELAPYQFYNGRASAFSDDEVSLRATWGARLKKSGFAALELLRDSPYSRRAYVPIFWAEDVNNQSKNLPCLVGFQLLLRDDIETGTTQLDMYTTMRSQSAIGVLPYDLFMLTMLQEMISLELVGVTCGQYYHFCPSLTIKESELSQAEKLSVMQPDGQYRLMSRMTRLTSDQAEDLQDLEKGIRKGRLKSSDIEKLFRKRPNVPPPSFWMGLLAVTALRAEMLREKKSKLDRWDWVELLCPTFPWPFVEKCMSRIPESTKA